MEILLQEDLPWKQRCIPWCGVCNNDAADIISTNMGMFQSDDFLGVGKYVVFREL